MTVLGVGRLVVRADGVEVDRRCIRDDTAPEHLAALSLVGQVEYTRPGEPAVADDVRALLDGAP